MNAEIAPALGGRAPEEITRRDVRAFVEAIAYERPYWANRVFELLRRVFSWAVENELLAASPCVGLKKPGGETPGTASYPPTRSDPSGRPSTAPDSLPTRYVCCS